jgi:transposase-like protein
MNVFSTPVPTGTDEPDRCPNEACPCHKPTKTWAYKKAGFFRRSSDGRRIQRFRCLECGRYFSSVTFATTYWLRLRHLLIPIAQLAVSGAGLRQIGRTLGVSHSTVGRHIGRAARHCLLLHSTFLNRHPLTESVAVDGIETYEYSQYFPCHFHLAQGRDTWLIYGFLDSPLRRKGSMTPHQKRMRALLEEKLGRPDPKAVERDMGYLVEDLLDRVPKDRRLDLRSDGHPAYKRAIGRILGERGDVIYWDTISSRAARTSKNPLNVINATDSFLRHSQANHRRETIAASKRRQMGLERLAVFMVWRNLVKRRFENGPVESSAMVGGWAERMWGWGDVFVRRLFRSEVVLPRRWDEYYERRVRTLIYGDRQVLHTCKYAC